MSKSRNRLKELPNGRKQIFRTASRRAILTGNMESAVSILARRGLLRRAARLAVQKQFACGVPAVWMENEVVYKIHPDGRKEALATRQRHNIRLSRQRYYIQK